MGKASLSKADYRYIVKRTFAGLWWKFLIVLFMVWLMKYSLGVYDRYDTMEESLWATLREAIRYTLIGVAISIPSTVAELKRKKNIEQYDGLYTESKGH